MKRIAMILLFTAPLFAGGQRTSGDAAANCIVNTLACGEMNEGALEPEDCISPQGSKYDIWQFDGTAGQVVEIRMTPVDATLTNPVLSLVPPMADDSATPMASGGSPVVDYVLSSSGTWTIHVGTSDFFASGRYLIKLSCAENPSPDSPQTCVHQTSACGQTFDWALTPTSCKFQDKSSYAWYDLGSIDAGQRIDASLTSADFNPGVAIYGGNGATVLAQAVGVQGSKPASASIVTTKTDHFAILVFGDSVASSGKFTLTVNGCTSSLPSCNRPVISSGPSDVVVPFSGGAKFSVTATGDTPLMYQWFRGNHPDTSMPLPGTDSTITLTNIRKSDAVWVRVTNSCASTDSATAQITIAIARTRRRVVGH